MSAKKENPLKGAFSNPVPGTPPPTDPADGKKAGELPSDTPDPKAPSAAPAKAGEEKKADEPPKATPDTKAADAAPAKAGEEKKAAEPPKTAPDTKAADAAPAKADEQKKAAEPPKTAPDTKAADTAPAKAGEEKKADEPPKAAPDTKAIDTNPAKADDEKKAAEPAKAGEEKKATEPPKTAPDLKGPGIDPAKAGEEKKADEPPKDPNIRFVSISKIVPLPGTYVKDTPRKEYKDLIDSIKKSGLEKPVILRQGEKGDYQLVDGFHRCEALKQAGMLEVRADVYEMTLTDADRYRKEHRDKPDLPIPGKLVPLHPAEPPRDAEAPAAPSGQDEEIPEDFKLPIAREGQAEIITTLKVDDIHPFEGHPFNVKDDKDMWDLVDSVKKFGVLEPVVVIPRKEGGYEMVSGHRRQRACQLAGVQTMPVIVRQLDRDEATISMVDANLKRENISPMEKARAYSMKLEAMKRKAGRRSKAEILNGEKPMRADEQLAQQTGESRANIQRRTVLNRRKPSTKNSVK